MANPIEFASCIDHSTTDDFDLSAEELRFLSQNYYASYDAVLVLQPPSEHPKAFSRTTPGSHQPELGLLLSPLPELVQKVPDGAPVTKVLKPSPHPGYVFHHVYSQDDVGFDGVESSVGSNEYDSDMDEDDDEDDDGVVSFLGDDVMKG